MRKVNVFKNSEILVIHSLYSNKCVDGGLFNLKKKELTTKKALLIKFEISTTINIVTKIKLIQ